jgi:hypothetical protein
MVHNPENVQPVDTLWAVLSKDENGNHGIIAMNMDGHPVPMITGSTALLEQFKRIAWRDAPKMAGKSVVVARYDRVGEDELIGE